MVPRTAYKKILKSLEFYKKQHLEDRRDNPNAMPADWGGPLRKSIETHIRESGIRFSRDAIEAESKQILEDFAKKGLLVPYFEGYTFPVEGQVLPTEQQIRDHVDKVMSSLGIT